MSATRFATPGLLGLALGAGSPNPRIANDLGLLDRSYAVFPTSLMFQPMP